MKMINAGYLDTECFPEMSPAELLCSLSDDTLLWGLLTAHCLCRNAQCASNKRKIFAVKSSFSLPQPCQALHLCSPSPGCSQRGGSPSDISISRSPRCSASSPVQKWDRMTHPAPPGSCQLRIHICLPSFISRIVTAAASAPPSRALLPSCPARSSSPHRAFLLQDFLSTMSLHPPELLLATSPPVCLRCSVMPAFGLFFPLFLAVLYNFNGTVTVSLNQDEIPFAQQKP